MPDEPNAETSSPKAEVFVSRNRQTHGPYPRDVVAKWIETGKINRFDLACTDQTPWQPVEKLLWPERFAQPTAVDSHVSITGLTRRQLALIIAVPVVLVALAVLFALGALRKASVSTTTNEPSSQTATTGNAAQDILLTQSPTDQAISLGKSVGEGCVGSYAYFMGMAKDKSVFWSVRCTNGKSYEVMISPDAYGSTKVLECGVLQLVTKVRCFEKLKD